MPEMDVRAGTRCMASNRLNPAWTPLVLVFALVGATAACTSDDDRDSAESGTGTTATPPTTAVPERAPPEYREHHTDWVLPGRDYDNSRATRDSAITAASVDELDPAWETPLDGGLSTVPLIVGDTIFVQDSSTRITALDRESGAVRWQTEEYGTNIGPFGVAVADGRVFGVHGSSGIVAVDAETGRELWVRDIRATPTAGVDIQPTVYDGLVLVSTVPISLDGIYTPGDRGILHALDAASGEVRWTFDTVVDDLWGHPEINSGGGAWYPPAIDPERGVVYWGVANPAPFPGTAEYPNGSSRPGDNLYTNSAVTVDVSTGALRWYHQVIPHDLFDRDLVHTMVARTSSGDVVVATGKGATVVGLDPDTGERLWTASVGKHVNDDLTELDGPTEVYPGTFGGVLTPPATADGVVYVATVNASVTLEPDEVSYFGAELGVEDGEIAAVDASTGEIVWQTDVPSDPLGGATVVNDLVFTALLDGQLLALDRATGEIIWEGDAPGGINGWMAVAGDLLLVPVGSAEPPRLVAYRLAKD